jgi:hypothetical protein
MEGESRTFSCDLNTASCKVERLLVTTLQKYIASQHSRIRMATVSHLRIVFLTGTTMPLMVPSPCQYAPPNSHVLAPAIKVEHLSTDKANQ